MKGGSWDWRRGGGVDGAARWSSWFAMAAEAAPWLSVGLVLLMLNMIGGTMTAARGFLFDLPAGEVEEGDVTSLVALAASMPGGTLVFFDDARYSLGDPSSVAAFCGHLSERVAATPRKTLLLLADKSVPAGDLMEIAASARRSGAKKVLFAVKRPEARPE